MGLAKKKYQTPPRSGMEVYMMLPEGTLAELINDIIYMSPTPDFYHQELSFELSFQLGKHVKENDSGKIVVAPMDVFFDQKNVLQPDILFITKENLSIVKSGKIKGSPDLIIEILSPGNKKHDTEIKKAVYEKFSVKEYFVVDPETKEVITWYLTKNKFVKQLSAKGKVKSKLLKKTFSF
jgi:Uma2 family endonuclease